MTIGGIGTKESCYSCGRSGSGGDRGSRGGHRPKNAKTILSCFNGELSFLSSLLLFDLILFLFAWTRTDCAATFGKMTFSTMTLVIMTLVIMTLVIITLVIMTLVIMTLVIKTQHYDSKKGHPS